MGSGGFPDPGPRQLPAVPVDFTGRQQELSELMAHCTADMAPVSPLVISGFPGVGKSALAVRLAHELASRYPDGQLHTGMRGPDGPIGPEVTLARFLRALGTAPGDVPADLSEQAALYRSLLSGRRVLVILDDASAEQQVRPLIPGEPSCLVVVTSRNPLPALASAMTYPLGPLDLSESLQLLGVVAGADRIAADPSASERVVELCGGLPLALRIAAARLRSRTDWTMGDLSARLSDTRRRLRELRVGDLDVRASLDLSYRELPADAAQLLRRLAIVPGWTFSSKLAASLCGLTERDIDELLDRLVLDQLLEPTGHTDRYGMHPLMRVFADGLLGEDRDGDRFPALKAMFRWYAEKLMEFVWSGAPRIRVPAEARAWLDAEEPHLVALLSISEQIGLDWYTSAVAFPVAAVARSRALWDEWKRAIDLGLGATRRLGEHNKQALLLVERGDYHLQWEWDLTAAEASLNEAAQLVDPVEAPGIAARLHYRLAQLHREAGRDGEAKRELKAAAAAAVSADGPEPGRIIDQYRAETLVEQEKFREAIDLLAPMASTWAGLDVTIEVPYRMLLAKAYVGERRYSSALDELKQCRQLCFDYELRVYAPEVQLLLGQVNRALGFKGRAQQAWKEGLTLFENTGHVYIPGMAARLAYELADSYSRAGKHTLADELFGQAAEAFERAEQYCNRAGALDRQAREKLAMGDRTGAVSAWETALTGLDRSDDPDQAERNRQLLRAQLRNAAASG